MPKSATGKTDPRARRRRFDSTASGGFTLLEVLVVVAIAAIVTSLVVLRIGGWQSGAEAGRQLERLAALVDHQCEQAIFQASPRGVRFTREGYDFWQSSSEGWVPVPDDRVARARSWQGEADLDLHVEGRRVALGDEPSAPQVLCQPLGELTAFTLTLASAGESARLSVGSDGQLALERR